MINHTTAPTMTTDDIKKIVLRDTRQIEGLTRIDGMLDRAEKEVNSIKHLPSFTEYANDMKEINVAADSLMAAIAVLKNKIYDDRMDAMTSIGDAFDAIG